MHPRASDRQTYLLLHDSDIQIGPPKGIEVRDLYRCLSFVFLMFIGFHQILFKTYVILIGNLGKKPELRQTNSGLAVTSLSVATSERRKGPDGQYNNQTEWHNVTVFGNQAENCSKYLDKGRQIYVEGRIQTRKWQDKDGNDRRSVDIVANDVRFLSSKGNADVGSSSYSSNNSSYNSNSNNFSNDMGGDDIPF